MAVKFGQPNEKLVNFINEISAIGSKGQYNQQMKLPKPKPPAALGAFQGAPGSTGPGGGLPAGTGTPGPLPGGSLGQLMQAVKGQESGGNYGAVNKDSNALGAYQILWSNLAANNGSDWDRQALGRDVSYSEFLGSPAIQDAIAKHKLNSYMQNRGAAGAIATWYGGDWGYKNMYDKKPQNGYPSMYEYVMSVLKKYQ